MLSFSFPEGTKHIVMNERCAGYGSRDVLDHNSKLNAVCPQIFPSLVKLRKNDLSLHLPPKGYDKFLGSTNHGKVSMKIPVRPQDDAVRRHSLH
jgi:hypothetical protein